MGFLQMAAAALGSFVVALLPYRNAFGMIALYGGFVALGWLLQFFGRAVYAVAGGRCGGASGLPGAPAPAAKFQVATRG